LIFSKGTLEINLYYLPSSNALSKASHIQNIKGSNEDDDNPPKINNKKYEGQVLIRIKLVDDTDSKTPTENLVVKLLMLPDRYSYFEIDCGE
jgi:hypothetical protein